MKKVLLFGAAVCGLLSAFTVKAEDEAFEAGGIYYQTLSDGIGVEVTSVPKGGVAYTGDIVIPSFVKHGAITYRVLGIGDEAFYGTEINSIKCSDTMRRLGKGCFQQSQVKTIDLGQGLEQFAEGCFGFGCQVETLSELPASLVNIDGCPFVGCKKLTAINVNEENPMFKSIDGVLFSKSGKTLVAFPWGKGTSYVIPEGTDTIGENILNSNSTFLEITFPSTLKAISRNAFYFCKKLVNQNDLPEGLESIGATAFSTCWKANLTIPSTVKGEIPATAFKDNRLMAKINIPAGVHTIGMNAFYGCYSATELTMEEGLDLIDDFAFANCSAIAHDIVFPESVTYIGAYAFQQVSKVKKFELGANITELGTGAFNGLTPEVVICHAVTPPTYKNTNYALWHNSEGLANSTLYVPAESVDAYKAANGWDQFTNVLPIEGTSAVDEVEAAAEVVSETYYTVSGVAVNAPAVADGQLYIVVRQLSDGTIETAKVLNR